MAFHSEAAYPQTKPDHSVLITKPIQSVDFDVTTGLATVHFGPGEEVTINLADEPTGARSGLYFVTSLADIISEHELAWADPAIIERDMAAFDG
jgi:hypothetical protein